jgi:hypothetical protein
VSNLTVIEKQIFEELFGMSGGYVLDFTDRSFGDFFIGSVGVDIFDPKYDYHSGSKANRIRAFWNKESDNLVGKILYDLLQYMKVKNQVSDDNDLYLKSIEIVKRLNSDPITINLDAISSEMDGDDFNMLFEQIKNSIERKEPEAALDRLHTLMTKYLRVLCKEQGIETDKFKPLHSLMGEYLKKLKERKLLTSDMSERIIRASISILEAFNEVRNNFSFAHDNPILSYDESLLIYNNITSLIRFVASIHKTLKFVKSVPTFEEMAEEMDRNFPL